jgi:XRE family transcriptional regulator
MRLFPNRLRDLRKSKKVFQKEIAALLDISDRQYRDYEAGKVDPPTSKTIALADYFNVSIDYLVGRTDNPEINK